MLFALKKYITLIVQYWKKIRSYKKKKKNKINCTSCSKCIILQRISFRQNIFMREFHYLRKYLQKLTHTCTHTHREYKQIILTPSFQVSFQISSEGTRNESFKVEQASRSINCRTCFETSKYCITSIFQIVR